MRFSERMRITSASKIIQKDNMDKDLRMNLWNVFYIFLNDVNDMYFLNDLHGMLYIQFFKKDLSRISYSSLSDEIQNTILNGEWFYVYDFIEIIIKFIGNSKTYKSDIENFKSNLNTILERENSAYRIIDDEIAPITDSMEIKEIETAQKNSPSNIQTHINTALGFLSDRQNPDYRNSIKESISAVEALCREITSESTLDKALPALGKAGIKMPSMLLEAFKKLYYFTNGESGIRHALMDEEEEPGFEEAKYMLVVCSAFVNYIQGKKAKA